MINIILAKNKKEVNYLNLSFNKVIKKKKDKKISSLVHLDNIKYLRIE